MGVFLRLLHAGVALVLIGWLLSIYLECRREVHGIQERAVRTSAELHQLEAETRRTQALIDGLRRDDPLVVEWVARERLNALGPGEIPLPPAPPATAR